jgi:hypothetical protein
MLHYLWDAAELTKHRPAWVGKRDWYIVQRELVAAISQSSIKAKPLSSVLFVPPPFRTDRKAIIEAERLKFMNGLMAGKGNAASLGLVIGIYKKIEDAIINRKLVLKHLPNFPLYLDEKSDIGFHKRFTNDIQMSESAEGYFIVIATFEPKGNYGMVREITGMAVNSQWIPFDDFRELTVLECLMDRSFVKCLRYNLSKGTPIANFLITDTENPTPLYCPDMASTDDDADTFIEQVKSGTYEPVILWADDATGPELPEPRE